MKPTELTGRFERERHFFDNSDTGGNRVIIGEIEPIGSKLTMRGADAVDMALGENVAVIKGEAVEGALTPGLVYRFWGKWITHPRFGDQFSFKSFTLEKPADQTAIINYLKQCKGIGYAIARQIWDQFGENAIEKLRLNPASVSETVKGLTLEKAESAAEFLRRSESIEKAKIELLSLLNGRNFPKKLVDQCLKTWGNSAAERIKHNPYLLMRFPRCGFGNTDKMYLDLGHPPHKLKRQALCLTYSITSQSSGDTWFPANIAKSALQQGIASSKLQYERALKLSRRAHMISIRDEVGTTWIAQRSEDVNESRVARYATGLLHGDAHWPNVDEIDGLTDHQQEKATEALQSRIGILAGSPGTGKTFTAAKVIRKLISRVGLEKVAVLAPTGKAAVRITEAMQDNGVPIRARTIHSALEVTTAEDGAWSFSRGDFFPLDEQFVFVDESSMVDCNLMASLLAAMDSTTHILFIGDTNQLSPVGHGAPLRDMIEAGIPAGELTEVQRNSGRIVQTCAEIRDQKRFNKPPDLCLAEGENLLQVECADSDFQIGFLEKTLNRFRDGDNYDAVWDVQVLVAVNKKSPLGRRDLNKKLQQLLNPNKPERGQPFAIGDKIINTKNGWTPSLDPDDSNANDEGKVYVANGEQAEVIDAAPTKIVARLHSPDRTIIIPKGITKPEGTETGKIGDEEDDRSPQDTGCSWELGYAISVHKSQGSEWPVAIVMLDDHSSAKMVQSRNWIYTAISRAKKMCMVVGKLQLANDICKRDGLRRKTFLVEKIKEQWPEGLEETIEAEAAIEPSNELDLDLSDIEIDFSDVLEGVLL